MKDTLTGDEWEVRAKVVINATGTAQVIYLKHCGFVSTCMSA